MALLPRVAGWRQDELGGATGIEFAAAAVFLTLVSCLGLRAAVACTT